MKAIKYFLYALIATFVFAGCSDDPTYTRGESEADGCYVVKGMVVDSVPRGNVLRYTVRVGATVLRVDALFRSFHMFNTGDDVFLTIPEHDCLVIPAAA